jgi:hypothetical protein
VRNQVQQLRDFGLKGMGLFAHEDSKGFKGKRKTKTIPNLGQVPMVQEGQFMEKYCH